MLMPSRDCMMIVDARTIPIKKRQIENENILAAASGLFRRSLTIFVLQLGQAFDEL